MKRIIIKLWAEDQYEPWMVCPMNAEGRFDYNFYAVPADIKIVRLTIEPDDPDSKITMTHYGGKYTP